jgi:hypothetical protein
VELTPEMVIPQARVLLDNSPLDGLDQPTVLGELIAYLLGLRTQDERLFQHPVAMVGAPAWSGTWNFDIDQYE